MADITKPVSADESEKTTSGIMLKHMAELKEMIEKNQNLAAVVETEPKKVLAKTYIEGTPSMLKTLVSNLISAYGFDAKGNNLERTIAVTLMVEDITPKK